LALGHVLVFIPIFPDLIESIANTFPDYPEDIVADLASSLYNGLYAMGGLIGNCSAGFIISLFSNENSEENSLPEAASLMGFILFIFSAIYAYFGGAL
jgi:hypothetical protein